MADKEVIVTGDGDRGNGALVAVILLLLVIGVGLFLYFGTNVFRGSGDTTIKVEAPAVGKN